MVAGRAVNWTHVQPLQHPYQSSPDHRVVPRRNRYVGNLAPMPGLSCFTPRS